MACAYCVNDLRIAVAVACARIERYAGYAITDLDLQDWDALRESYQEIRLDCADVGKTIADMSAGRLI